MTQAQKKKSKAIVHKLHAKFYGKKPKAQEPKTPDAKPAKSKAGEPSRNELMLKAKERGIKNFRVINKEELVEILKDGTTKERIDEIVAGAVARWKAGWGKGKKKQ
ncbi:MAG: hypothetical protein PHO42_03515 [Candidatus Omnitrophica bacterium]|nr:hypothetical protein [Candidatus Omnitrophota bacterium]